MAEKQDILMNAFTPATDAEYIYAEAADGSQIKIKKSDLISLILGSLANIKVNKSDGSGAGILQPNVGIVFAYNSNNPTQYIIYMYIKSTGEIAVRIPLVSNELTLGGKNNQGTSVVNGADTQICLYISK